MTTVERVLWCALAVGLAFGVVGQITGFCLNRALRDYHVYRSDSKLRSFLLAMGVAVLGMQSASMLGLVDLQKSIYLVPSISWLLLPIGGIFSGGWLALTLTTPSMATESDRGSAGSTKPTAATSCG